jgi:Domain of unknown function (DU1801)
MTITQYLNELEKSRSSILHKIHQIIIESDPNVDSGIGMMMGKKMIIYKQEGIFKYALASSKEYLSLHIMTIYGSSVLHSKYKSLLPNARFQKGCINFKSDLEMPADVLTELIRDSARINMKKLFDDYRMKGKTP